MNPRLPSPRTAHADIRTWHANIEQHASEGVNKILIGNKSDWSEKRAVTEEQGRELANELGIKFMETSAKVNEGVEEAFFTLARSVSLPLASCAVFPFLAASSPLGTLPCASRCACCTACQTSRVWYYAPTQATQHPARRPSG